MINRYRKGEKNDNSRKSNAENHHPMLGGGINQTSEMLIEQ